ncbi:MAG TPA: hypothetical protein VFA38_08575 [Nitrospirales bacterium]|nr:hypothetical protein [Nitrospirales bacterium]
MARPSKATAAKRAREVAKQVKQREKDARREFRKQQKDTAVPRPDNGEDPDLAGLRWGPQEPLYR